MAKFRKNHGTPGRRSSFVGRATVVTAALVGMIIYGFINLNVSSRGELSNKSDKYSGNSKSIPLNTDKRNFIPDDGSDVVHHSYYSIGYNPDLEVPNWVAYKLTEESLRIKNVKRAKRFIVDNEVKGKSARHSDYTNSGYTRGHMAPAGDMAFNVDAMQESFYMSNMAPQLRVFNNGIWRELEENVRDWAYDNDEIYVVSGPLFYSSRPKKIGQARVAVPDAFFKVVLDIEGNKQKSIAFIIPHEKSKQHLREYAVTIDKVEEELGYDLFADLLIDESREAELEGNIDVNRWQFDKKRFNQRVNHWNNEK